MRGMTKEGIGRALILAAWCCQGQAVAETPSTSRPNILFVLADDQRWDTIAALGNKEIKTPNLDRLVGRGMTFTNAYCMGSMIPAVCLPSRTMIMTGKSLWRIPSRPQSTDAPPGAPILPAALRKAGYATFHCGKEGNSCRFAHRAFEINVEQKGRTAESATECANAAIAFLRDHSEDRPFFMYLAPPVPHDPRLAPPSYHAMYEPARLTLSANFLPKHPFDNGWLDGRDEMLAARPRTPAAMRQHLAEYYATITHLDHEVGRVLATIEDRGWMANTLVIYSSDQGLAVGGRHGLMGKQNLYEHVKPPLVIAGPGVDHGRSGALLYLFDLFPTICDFAGATVPPAVEGNSLRPILEGKRTKHRDWLLGAFQESQRMVRDDRWKLLEYSTAGMRSTQLFDLTNDPDEINNLANDQAAAPQRVRLAQLMRDARREFGDPTPIDFTSMGSK